MGGALRVTERRWWAANSSRVCARSLKSKRGRARLLTWPSGAIKQVLCGNYTLATVYWQFVGQFCGLKCGHNPQRITPIWQNGHFRKDNTQIISIFSVVDLRGIIFGKTWKCQANWLLQRCSLLSWNWKGQWFIIFLVRIYLLFCKQASRL